MDSPISNFSIIPNNNNNNNINNVNNVNNVNNENVNRNITLNSLKLKSQIKKWAYTLIIINIIIQILDSNFYMPIRISRIIYFYPLFFGYILLKSIKPISKCVRNSLILCLIFIVFSFILVNSIVLLRAYFFDYFHMAVFFPIAFLFVWLISLLKKTYILEELEKSQNVQKKNENVLRQVNNNNISSDNFTSDFSNKLIEYSNFCPIHGIHQ